MTWTAQLKTCWGQPNFAFLKIDQSYGISGVDGKFSFEAYFISLKKYVFKQHNFIFFYFFIEYYSFKYGLKKHHIKIINIMV